MKYQEHEIKAYFGDFYEDYSQQADEMLDDFDWFTIEHYMDKELAEDIHGELAPCENKVFLMAYMMAHTEKYGDDFTIS